MLADGRNVYPEDIEQLLNQHPLVKESCVVGLAQEGGETVHAVFLTDAPVRAGEIVRETNRRPAAHQQIMGYTVWAEADLPRTPILKVDRKLVRAAVQRQQTRAAPLQPPEAIPAVDPLVGLIARVTGRPASALRDELALGADLGLDSIGRIELLSLIEEEMGRAIDEVKVEP